MTSEKLSLYQEVKVTMQSLLQDQAHWVTNCSQFVSLLFYSLPDLNWVGFYFRNNNELLVGPFQGKPACIRIPLGKGACGQCAATDQAIIIDDVNTFPGYIACEAITRSEIVLPVTKNNRVIAVLDLDSPKLSRFDQGDLLGIIDLLDILTSTTDFVIGSGGIN
jgi:L-methionine (R)-S-oxide reductase